jgi:hypothetical protein
MNTTMMNMQKNVVNVKETLNKASKPFRQREMHKNGTPPPDH